MEISLGLYPNAPASALVRTAQLAERSGYARIWMADSHLLWREPHTMLGAIAQVTDRIGLATCVTNPLTRHPTVTAAAFATLAELSGGRATLGISVGDSSLKSMGLKPATMARLADCIRDLRALFAGEAAVVAGGDAATVSYAGQHTVPIDIAATGPKMLKLSGAIADGVVLMNGVAPELIQAACDLIAEGAREAGRDPASVRRVVWAACHVSAENPQRSINLCKYNVARAILRNIPGPIDERTRAVAEQVRARYDYAQHGDAAADFAELIPDDIVPRFAFAGSPDDIRGQIRALEGLGIEEVALAVPLDPDSIGRDAIVSLMAPGD